MKAFIVGLLFLIAVMILSGIGLLLYPFIIAMALLFRILLPLLFIIFSIWLLGKLIIFVWEKLFAKK
ncbi:MAG: hypothetical protein WAQ07_01010 [Candidatus Omnitrophota bacterium]